MKSEEPGKREVMSEGSGENAELGDDVAASKRTVEVGEKEGEEVVFCVRINFFGEKH